MSYVTYSIHPPPLAGIVAVQGLGATDPRVQAAALHTLATEMRSGRIPRSGAAALARAVELGVPSVEAEEIVRQASDLLEGVQVHAGTAAAVVGGTALLVLGGYALFTLVPGYYLGRAFAPEAASRRKWGWAGAWSNFFFPVVGPAVVAGVGLAKGK
jgi:hypothetical protein